MLTRQQMISTIINRLDLLPDGSVRALYLLIMRLNIRT